MLIFLRLVLFLLLAFTSACAPQFVEPEVTRETPRLESATFTGFDATRLPLRSWLPDSEVEAVVIALHGFNDYANFISDAAVYFSNHGVAVLAYDQRGFGAAPNPGRWPGSNAFAQDLQVLISLVQVRYPDKPLFLLGESMGAAVVLQALSSSQIHVDGVILSAPAVWGWSTMPWWQRWGLTLAAHTFPWSTFTGESLEIMASDNREMLIALGSDPLIIKETRVDTIYGLVNLMQAGFDAVGALKGPALVLYGDKDEVIPKAPILETFGTLVEGSENKRLLVYKNGYHMLLRDLQAEVVWRDILSWIRDGNNPLPSEKQLLSESYKP